MELTQKEISEGLDALGLADKEQGENRLEDLMRALDEYVVRLDAEEKWFKHSSDYFRVVVTTLAHCLRLAYSHELLRIQSAKERIDAVLYSLMSNGTKTGDFPDFKAAIEVEKTDAERERKEERKLRGNEYRMAADKLEEMRFKVSDPTLKGWACEGNRASPH